MTNTRLLKAKLALKGYDNFTEAIKQILGVSQATASSRINGKSNFNQAEIGMIAKALELSGDEIKAIFTGG